MEYKAMTLAEKVYSAETAWKQAEAAGKWEEWARANPRLHAMLALIMLDVAGGNND
jgi:hypothetical protein